ncbi:protein vein isoform X2 [Musca domestica]|uniref:Protein vein isoform X2 n=1 Tax=Musca domestica TaxID=7370 RepID=A0ABM3UPT7_MUSDO|nr:protein vein isoform X2 [Musca domestica]
MNARILRKWSIHTKNLMSCSACSLVVVVLLLLPLLLVTCAATPALALAAMNLPQSQRTTTALHTLSSSSSSSLLWPTTSLALASTAAGVEKEEPMPKNVHHAAGAGEAIAAAVAAGGVGGVVRETLQASSNKQRPTLTWPTTIFASAAPATSLSYQQQQQQQQPQSQLRREPTKLLASSSLQAYRSYGSGTRHQASQRLEVANNGGDIMAREPFPGFYTQQQPRPDDIQPTWPLAARQYAKPTSSGSNNGGLLAPAWLVPKNKDILKPGTSQQMGEWAQTPLRPLESHHHTEETDDADDDDNMDDFMADKLGVDANNNYEEQEQEEENDFNGSDDDDDDDVENEDISQMTDNKYQDNKATTRLSGRNIKSLETRRYPYRQHYYQQQQQQQKEQQRPSPTTSHTQTPNIITKTTTTTVFSSPNHKSMEPNIGSGGGGGGDKVFDISNILKVNKIKSSAARAPIRFVIESYEVAPLPLSLSASTTASQRGEPAARRLKQLRSRHEQQQQAARNRRDSLRGGYNKRNQQDSSSPSSSSSSSMYFRHHHHNNNNHQRLRNKHDHRRRYCSARDPAQLAFEAPTVFEGKIVSMTPDRRMNFSATVEVREVFKQQIGYRLQKYLRLQFAYRNSSGECDIYREQLRPRGLVRGDTIEPGRIYLLFVQQLDIGNFTILGQPIRKTKRVVEAVRNAVSENYAQLASIRSISASNRTVENGQELRIVCKVTGRPPPKVTWFKDHRSINRNRKLYQFIHYKKRSELIIRSFNTSDAGRYECRAKNKVNRNIERRTIVIKAYPVVQRFDPNPRGAGNTCPDDASEFCFNGGTCKFFSEISSYSCICPEGFIGERCDRKEVNNPNFMLQSTAKYTPLII